MKILVVDDSKTMRNIIKNILNKIENEEILEAENGVTALQLLKKNPDIKILITDWNMPEMNGLDLVNHVRSFKHFSNTKIIMVTTEGTKNEVLKAIKAGVNDYIIKPFTPDILSEKFQQLFIG